MTAGERIKQARKEKKMTQRDLAYKMGLSPQTVAQWENNLRNPKLDTLEKIAKALDVPVSDLLGFQPLPTEGIISRMKLELFQRKLILDSEDIDFPEYEKQLKALDEYQKAGLDLEDRKALEEIVLMPFLSRFLRAIGFWFAENSSPDDSVYIFKEERSGKFYLIQPETIESLTTEIANFSRFRISEIIKQSEEYMPPNVQEAPLSAEDETAPENNKSPE